MEMLIQFVLTFILAGSICFLAITFLADGNRIIEALSGNGVDARSGQRKKHQYRVTFVTFAERRANGVKFGLVPKAREAGGMRLVVDNSAGVAPTAGPPGQLAA